MSSPPPTRGHWYLHKSRRDDLVKPGVKPPDLDFADHQAPEGRPPRNSSSNFGRRSAALPSHLSLSGGFAPGFIRSPLRGCASWTTCVDITDAGSVEAIAPAIRECQHFSVPHISVTKDDSSKRSRTEKWALQRHQTTVIHNLNTNGGESSPRRSMTRRVPITAAITSWTVPSRVHSARTTRAVRCAPSVRGARQAKACR